MRSAIIGSGFIANTHAQVLKSLGHELVTVVNPTLAHAEAFARQWGAHAALTDYHDAFTGELDCVHVCTPPTSHYPIIKAALAAGIHVISEKPLCPDPTKAFELSQLAEEKNLVNAVNFNVRFHAACQQARKTITAPDFGNIHLIHGAYLQEFHVLPAEFSWRYQPEIAGPMRATTEIGSHWIDLVRFWTRLEVVEVSANFGNFEPQRTLKDGLMSAIQTPEAEKITIDSEDAAVISLRFNNGAIGSLLLSEVSHGRSNRLSLEITSAEHSLWWNSEEPQQLNQAQKFSGVNTQTLAFAGGFPETFQSGFELIYADIKTGQPCESPAYATFKDGAINAKICDAIYRSAKHNATWIPCRK